MAVTLTALTVLQVNYLRVEHLEQFGLSDGRSKGDDAEAVVLTVAAQAQRTRFSSVSS